MPPVGYEPTISAGERSKNYALDHAAIGTGSFGSQTPKTDKETMKHVEKPKRFAHMEEFINVLQKD